MSYFFFEDFFAAFLAGFFAAFLAAIQLPPSPRDMDPIGSIGLAGSMWCCDVDRIAPTRTSSVTPRVSPRTLFDEYSETLAADENGPLFRVGSVASVEATASSIAIQVL